MDAWFGWRGSAPLLACLSMACGPSPGGGGGTDSSETSNGSSTTLECNVGSLGCECTVGGGCDPGLSCEGGVCMPEATSTSMPPTSSSSSPSESSSSEESSSSSSWTSATTGIPKGCGDDELEAPEECDDGNNESGDGCNADCTLGGQLVWQHNFDGEGSMHDWALRVAVDSDDNVIVSGMTFVAMNEAYGWLLKLDDDGQHEWDTVADEDGNRSGFWGVAVGPADQIVVGGWVYNETNTTDAIVRAYSPDGVELWTYTEEGPFYDEQVFDVAIDVDGNVVALANGRDPDDGSLLTRLIKLTLDGDPVWTEAFPNGNHPTAYALAVDSMASIYYGGGDGTALVRKMSPDADEEWVWQSEAGAWAINGLVVDAQDAVIAGGGIGNSPAHSRVARHLGDGSVIDWDVEWPGPHGAYAMTRGVAIDSEGRPVTAGPSSGGMESTLFVRKYDANGEEEMWLYEQDTVAQTDTLNGVAVDSTDHVIAVGTQNQDNSYDDFLIIKLTP